MEKIVYLDKDGKPCPKDQALLIEHTVYDDNGKPLRSHFALAKPSLSDESGNPAPVR